MKSDYEVLYDSVVNLTERVFDGFYYPYTSICEPIPDLEIELRDALFVFNPRGGLKQIKLGQAHDRILRVYPGKFTHVAYRPGS